MPIKLCPKCGGRLRRNRKGGHRFYCIGFLKTEPLARAERCGYVTVA